MDNGKVENGKVKNGKWKMVNGNKRVKTYQLNQA
jgi:hypothetical protein